MKLSIHTKELKAALGKLSSLPGAKIGPIASLLQITADGFAGFTLARSTPEAEAITTCGGATIEDDGDAIVDIKQFSGILDRIAASEVEIRSDDKFVYLAAGKQNGRVGVLNEVRCKVSEIAPVEFRCLGEDVHRWLSIALGGASDDRGRPHLIGVVFRAQLDAMTVFGTDGRRVHIATCAGLDATPLAPSDRGYDAGVMIPSEAAECVRKAIAGEKGACVVSLAKNGAKFTIGSTSIRVGTMESAIPDVLPAIAKGPIDVKVACDREALLSAVRSVGPVSDEEPPRLRLRFEEEEILLEAVVGKGAQGFSDRVSAEVEAESSHATVCEVNAVFLARFLEGSASKRITIEIDNRLAMHVTEKEYRGCLMMMKPR